MKHLEIKNYKSIKHITLSELSTINVIVGNNNVGKSSLLEAISIGATKGSLEQINEILHSRGEGMNLSPWVTEKSKENELKSMLSLYPNRNREEFYDSPIEVVTDEKNSVSIQLAIFIEEESDEEDGTTRIIRRMMTPSERSDKMFCGEMLAGSDGLVISYGERKKSFLFGQLRPRSVDKQENYPLEYVDSHDGSDTNPDRFDKIALTDEEEYILEALQIIEPSIRGINFLKDNDSYTEGRVEKRIPYIVMGQSAERYKLSSMGDGINRILTIVLAMANCKNGILLIDEIENGLHYTVQYALWRVILKMAKKLQIQLFATTHSMDTIRALVALRDKELEAQQYMACYYLQESAKGELISYRYSAEKLDFLLKNGEDIR